MTPSLPWASLAASRWSLRDKPAAGEHYAAMRLAMIGVTPALLPARTPDADLIATAGGARCTLQVKTTGAAGRPVVDMDAERIFLPDFLILVTLNMAGHYGANASSPVAYVLPRDAVFDAWQLGGYDHPIRPGLRLNLRVRVLLDEYREAWSLVAQQLGAEEGKAR